MASARTLSGQALIAALQDSRAVLLSRVDDLDAGQWQVPQQEGVNPIAWELAHVAWFAEFWILRGPHHVGTDGFVHAVRPAHLVGPDDCFDSARLAHARRWSADLPPRGRLLQMLRGQLDACLAAVPRADDDEALYFHRLSLFHEDMHAEAFAWLRGVLGYPAPAGVVLPRVQAGGRVSIAGGEALIGWPEGRRGFVFDNEQANHAVRLGDFEIDAAPVSAGQFASFVEAGGYDNPAYWPAEAGAWRARSALSHPQRWRPKGGEGWEVRWFDRWLELNPKQPVIHVNAWEAQAYCLWARRRLPAAVEWEHAACAAPTGAFQWGHTVWEWTADPFEPYAGFRPGPYKDYSAPWFGDHRELRGGAFVTHERLHDMRYRNFFQAHRTDIFAGFRTAAM